MRHGLNDQFYLFYWGGKFHTTNRTCIVQIHKDKTAIQLCWQVDHILFQGLSSFGSPTIIQNTMKDQQTCNTVDNLVILISGLRSILWVVSMEMNEK